jgi:hypothetical protein
MGQVHSKRIAGNYVEYQDHEKRLIDARGTDVIKLFEDFVLCGAVASDSVPGWTTTLVEAGAGESTVALQDGSGGELLITTDANEDDGAQIQKAAEAFGFSTSQKATYFGIRMKAGEATQSDFLVGLCITDTTLLGGMSDGVYFRKVDGSTAVSFVTEKDSTETEATGVLTFAADTYYLLEFYFDGTSIEAFVDGVKVAQHTTNIPDDELLTPSIAFLSGNAAAETMTVDWVRAIQIGRS